MRTILDMQRELLSVEAKRSLDDAWDDYVYSVPVGDIIPFVMSGFIAGTYEAAARAMCALMGED